MQDNEKYILQSVDNSLVVLELFGKYKELGVSEVSELMNIGKSTAFRILATLENRNYLLKQENSKYRLGLKLFSLGHVVRNELLIKNHAYPFLKKLTTMTGETSHLVIWYDTYNIIFIEKVLSSSSIRMHSHVGYVAKAHLTASGKALLSACPDDEVRYYADNTVFEQKTPTSIMTAAQLFSNIREIRENGYAMDDEESEAGLTCYAAPIIDPLGHAIASISISGPTQRMLEKQEVHINWVKQIADEMKNTL